MSESESESEELVDKDEPSDDVLESEILEDELDECSDDVDALRLRF